VLRPLPHRGLPPCWWKVLTGSWWFPYGPRRTAPRRVR